MPVPVTPDWLTGVKAVALVSLRNPLSWFAESGPYSVPPTRTNVPQSPGVVVRWVELEFRIPGVSDLAAQLVADRDVRERAGRGDVLERHRGVRGRREAK